MTTSTNAIKEQIIEKAWNDTAFKAALVADPKAALQEAFNIELPEGVQLSVVEETAERLVLFIPPNPVEMAKKSDVITYTW
ncbi:NHLP leader peptide family RiPP precursor [Paenibacillus glycinis]|uniref:NHLP leader peptide family natural product n=1 Tax=Paenibacillus glycinis TaxID=2697035 RepID=A0ABW9XKJ6_9BACL|nr:NHLP leader peptide family RiPP precursor [Paenibacillus glycinis]NBD23120.1 NHLP leader peptide family natural product precursor [Paenibacillus glycinis]